MRPGQHKNNNNNNRNRNRNSNNNNRRNTGGGGSPNNKVFDSNGPDIKLRGTTQTIAEKYMQMDDNKVLSQIMAWYVHKLLLKYESFLWKIARVIICT